MFNAAIPGTGMTPGVANSVVAARTLEGRVAGQGDGLAGIGLGMRVVDDLGDLHELDAGRNTVKTGHSVPQLLDRPEFLGGCDLWESWDS